MTRIRPSHGLGLLLGAGVVLAYFGHLLLPGRILMVRDLPFLHLPLRETFAALAQGLAAWPDWNPAIHGGQPILSNPHYAAWYPPTWLGLALPVRWAIHVSVLAHAALAFAGAWRLLRQLGASRWGCAFAAVAFAGGGFFVALTNTLLVFTGMAWTPWILAGADAWLRSPRAQQAPGARPASARVLATAVVPLGLQILNGDPASVVVALVFVLLLAWNAGRTAGRGTHAGGVAARTAVLLLVALALGSIQLVPTWMRLQESSRGAGLSLEQATVWSAQPARLIETAFPTFYGDATRDEENLYFGWTLHDRQFPLLISIYPGLLTLCLGLAGFAVPIARRGVWLGAAAIGLFFGLGRHNPLFAAAHATLPFLGMVRYPEKFLLLPLVALVVSASLLFDRQLTEPSAAGASAGDDERRSAPWPAVVAGALVVAAAARTAWSWAAPAAVIEWMERSCGFALSPAVEAAGLAYLRRDAMLSLLTVGTALLVLLGLRVRPQRRLGALALVFLAADGWSASHRFNPTLPLEEFTAPELARSAPREHRLFSDVAFYRGPAVGLPVGRRGFHQVQARLDRLEPYSAVLWGHAYALHEDYDLMLTSWGRHALGLLHEIWPDEERRAHLLDAWDVGTLVRVRTPSEIQLELQEARRDGQARGASRPAVVSARLEPHPTALPRLRLARAVAAHETLERAVTAARADAFDAGKREHLVAPVSLAGATPIGAARGEILAVEVRTDERAARYRIDGVDAGAGERAATLVVAETYDTGWTARDEKGERLTILPTALGQMAVLLPLDTATRPVEGRVHLVYSDPWVRVGAAVTLVALLSLALAISRSRPRS